LEGRKARQGWVGTGFSDLVSPIFDDLWVFFGFTFGYLFGGLFGWDGMGLEYIADEDNEHGMSTRIRMRMNMITIKNKPSISSSPWL
jgi:hypothetical protein